MKEKRKAPKPSIASKPKRSSKVGIETRAGDDTTWIRIKNRIEIPQSVRGALNTLHSSGAVAYLVGGCVRDHLLQRPVKDFDIATSAHPDEICALFPEAITVGKAFGVLKVPSPDGTFEIATFRKDLDYVQHRYPRKVLFMGTREDAMRRDFTVNAFFYDPKRVAILDHVGGMSDLKKKILRAIGDPLERFEEDALRLIRAVRFSSALDFSIEPRTAQSMKKRSKLIAKVSGERIRDELSRILIGPGPHQAIQRISDLGLGVHILPELEYLRGVPQSPLFQNEGDLWAHTLEALRVMAEKFPGHSQSLGWAVLLHNLGKPTAAQRSQGKNFNNHEVDAVRFASKVLERFKFSRDDSDRVLSLISEYPRFSEVFRMREATLIRWVKQPYFEELLQLHYLQALVSDGNLSAYEYCLGLSRKMKMSPERVELIDGRDLIQLGLEPGPRFTQILKEVESMALEGKLKNKQQALEFVLKHFL